MDEKIRKMWGVSHWETGGVGFVTLQDKRRYDEFATYVFNPAELRAFITRVVQLARHNDEHKDDERTGDYEYSVEQIFQRVCGND